MKPRTFILIGIVLIAFVLIIVFRIGLNGQGEDSWIKNEKGVWVKHGFPSTTPEEVLEQQKAITDAFNLYTRAKLSGMQFSSQCLGIVGKGDAVGNGLYVADIIHVPRTDEDNEVENQCPDYINGKAKNFIELDKDGNLIKVG